MSDDIDFVGRLLGTRSRQRSPSGRAGRSGASQCEQTTTKDGNRNRLCEAKPSHSRSHRPPSQGSNQESSRPSPSRGGWQVLTDHITKGMKNPSVGECEERRVMRVSVPATTTKSHAFFLFAAWEKTQVRLFVTRSAEQLYKKNNLENYNSLTQYFEALL